MNIKRYAAAIAVVSIALAMLAMPVAAVVKPAPTGSVNGQFNAQVTAPTIISVTGQNTVQCIPDGVNPLSLNVIIQDVNGAATSDHVTAQLYSGSTAIGSPVTVTGGTASGTNQATFVANVPFEYYYAAGTTYTVQLTAGNTANMNSGPSTFGPVTYSSALGLTIDSGASLNFGTLGLNDASASQQVTIHNSANTAIQVNGNAADWQSSVSGAASVPASTLVGTGNGAPQNMGQATPGGALVNSLPIGAHPPASAPIGFVETIPGSLSGPYTGTYTTMITLTGVGI